MIRRPPRSTPLYSSAASDVYKRQLQYMVDILNRLPSMKSYRGTEFDPDTHDALTVIRDFASGSDPKGSLEAESIVILDVVLQENGYAVRGNTRLRKVLEYAEVPGLTRNPQ